MATSQSMIDFILDQVSALPSIRAQKMFGEYALYCEDKVVALVCDNQLFVKITPVGKALLGKRYQEGKAYPGANPSMVVGAEELDNSDRLCELIRVTANALPASKPKRANQRRPK
jgi:DNA transformation protein and related proteins